MMEILGIELIKKIKWFMAIFMAIFMEILGIKLIKNQFIYGFIHLYIFVCNKIFAINIWFFYFSFIYLNFFLVCLLDFFKLNKLLMESSTG
jgi:hypothetical protein